MSSISEIEQQLLSAASALDVLTIREIMENLTEEEASQIDAGVYAVVLQAAFAYQIITPDNTAAVTQAVGVVVEKIAPHIDAELYVDGMLLNAQFGNIAGVKVMAENLTEYQADYLGESESLFQILLKTAQSTVDDPELATDTTNIIMQASGDHITMYSDLVILADIFADNGNYDGINAIVDNLGNAQFDGLKVYESILTDMGVILLTNGNDKMPGMVADGTEAVFGGAGDDVIRSDFDGAYLYGGDGIDWLIGSYFGDDVLNGGDGVDILIGQGGADRFVLSDGTTGVDKIGDFRPATGDVLDISNILTGFDPLTDSLSDFVAMTAIDGTHNKEFKVDADGAGAAHDFVTVALIGYADGLTLDQMIDGGSIVA